MKLIKTIITLLLILTIFPKIEFGFVNVSACTISDFNLYNINNDQSKTNLGCFTSFSSAKVSMESYKSSYNNLIITHSKSLSPMKIVAASRAVAASYPLRRTDNFKDNSVTLTVHQYTDQSGNFSGFNTYMQAYRDLFYYSTEYFDPTTGNGVAYIEINGFKGYVHIKSIDIIPLIYVEKGWSVTLGGNTYEEVVRGSTTEEKPFSLIPKVNKYRVYSRLDYVDANGMTQSIREIGHETFSTYSGASLSEYTYGKAPDWLPNGIYYSPDSIRFYYDIGLTQPVYNNGSIGEYYNYYQYLPLRSESNLSSTDFDRYVSALGYNTVPTSYATLQSNQSMLVNQGATFKFGEAKYGINSLLIYALAMHESGSGRSSIAINYLNLYGWGAYDSNVGAAKRFNDIQSSIYEFMGLHIRGFISIENWRFFSTSLGTKNSGLATKYASDPYWANKIAGWAYRIDRYNGFKDYNYYSIGLIEDGLAYDVKNSPITSSSTLYSYNSQIGTNKIRNYAFIINDNFTDGNSSSWFETLSTQPINSAGSAVFYKDASAETDLVDYLWSKSRGYVNTNKIKIISTGVSYKHIPFVYDELLSSANATNITTISYDQSNNLIGLNGTIFKHGLPTIVPEDVKYKLFISNTSVEKNIELDTSLTPTTSITTENGKSKYIYDYSGYLKNGIDLNQLSLSEGVYNLSLGVSVSNLLKSNKIEYRKSIHINDFAEINFEKNSIEETPKLYQYSLKNINGVGLILIVKQKNVDINIPNFIHIGTIGEQARIELPSTYANITYSSSDSNIITVTNELVDGIANQNGVITSVNEGNATISIIQDGSVEVGKILVFVDVVNNDFTLNKINLNFTNINEQETIVSSGNSGALKFYSLNSAIATVNSEGIVKPISNGYTTIKVFNIDGSIVKDVSVVVNLKATSIQLNKENGLLVTNLNPQQLNPTFDANNALNQDLVWSSSNESIVKVSNGKLASISSGNATITAKLNDSVYSTIDVKSMILGDNNKDNKTDLLDLIALRRYLTSQVTFDSLSQDYGDINRDGKVDLLDLIKLRRILIGME